MYVHTYPSVILFVYHSFTFIYPINNHYLGFSFRPPPNFQTPRVPESGPMTLIGDFSHSLFRYLKPIYYPPSYVRLFYYLHCECLFHFHPIQYKQVTPAVARVFFLSYPLTLDET